MEFTKVSKYLVEGNIINDGWTTAHKTKQLTNKAITKLDIIVTSLEGVYIVLAWINQPNYNCGIELDLSWHLVHTAVYSKLSHTVPVLISWNKLVAMHTNFCDFNS